MAAFGRLATEAGEIKNVVAVRPRSAGTAAEKAVAAGKMAKASAVFIVIKRKGKSLVGSLLVAAGHVKKVR